MSYAIVLLLGMVAALLQSTLLRALFPQSFVPDILLLLVLYGSLLFLFGKGLLLAFALGLQGGVVVDWLSDGWYRDVDLVNLRTELSWVIDSTHEVGFWGAFGTKDSEEPAANDQLADWETTDLYAVFYRYSFGGCREGDARLFAGWSGQSDGLLGADARLPLSDTWALETNFTYLIPNEGDDDGADADYAQESWNVGINLVWYPGRHRGQGDRYYRPLFRVADNGVFMMDRSLP